MERCECEIVYGDPAVVCVTARTPKKTVGVVPSTEAARKSVRKFAEAWSRAANPVVFNQHMERFFELADGPWQEFVKPELPDAHVFKFAVTPIEERSVRKKTGFSLAKNQERLFYKVRPANDFVKSEGLLVGKSRVA
jgi:hypothetical protein